MHTCIESRLCGNHESRQCGHRSKGACGGLQVHACTCQTDACQTDAKQMPTQTDLSIMRMRHEHASPQHARMVPSLPLSRSHFTLPASLAGALILTLPVDCAIAIGCKRSRFWDDVARAVCGSALHHSDTCQRKRSSVNAKARAREQYPVPSPTRT